MAARLGGTAAITRPDGARVARLDGITPSRIGRLDRQRKLNLDVAPRLSAASGGPYLTAAFARLPAAIRAMPDEDYLRNPGGIEA